jgi:hypothetical protein
MGVLVLTTCISVRARKFVGLAWLLGITAITIIRHTVNSLDKVIQALGYPLIATFFGAMLLLNDVLAVETQR